jgi:hypothetical protein
MFGLGCLGDEELEVEVWGVCMLFCSRRVFPTKFRSDVEEEACH